MLEMCIQPRGKGEATLKAFGLLWLLAYLNLVDLNFGPEIRLGWVPKSPGNISRFSICACSIHFEQSNLHNILELSFLEC